MRYDALQRVRRSRSSSWPATPSDACSRRSPCTLRRRCARPASEPSPVVPKCDRRTCIVDARVRSPMRSDCTTLASTSFESNVYSSHTSECARRLSLACWSASSSGTTTPRCVISGPGPPVGVWRTCSSGAPAEAARPGGCQGCCLAALGRTPGCFLMRVPSVRCTDVLGVRGQRVWVAYRALARVFCRPCPLLGGARSRYACNK